jgi:O-antigen/teichoic acid export membrane protein
VSVARAILGNIGATFLGYVIALATGVLTARYLGPEGKGIYVLALLIPHLAVNALTLGVGSASTYFIARGERDPGTALGTSLAIVLPLGLACTLVIQGLLWAGWWTTPHAAYIGLAVWSILPTMGAALVRNVLLGLQRYTLFNWLIVVDKAVLLALLALGGLVWRGDLWMLCVLFVVASYLSFGIAFGRFRRLATSQLAFDLPYARQALHYGFRGHIGWLADMLNYRLDMLFVGGLAGATALGLYSAAVSLAETLWILPSCVSLVVMPRLASARIDSSGMTATLCRLLSPLMLLATLALAVLGGPLIALLYGSQFQASLRPLLLLLPGVALLSLVKVLSADFAARGRPGLVSAVSWISLAVTIALDLTLIRPFGAAGAAMASSVAYAASTAVTLFLFWRLTSLTPASVLLPRLADARIAWGVLQQILQRPSSSRAVTGRELP